VGENQIERYYILSIKSTPKSPEGDLFDYKHLLNGAVEKGTFTPQPPKGGFINISKSISPPWGI